MKTVNHPLLEPTQEVVIYEDGEPCPHKGCEHHISHPCETCNRKGAIGESEPIIRYKERIVRE